MMTFLSFYLLSIIINQEITTESSFFCEILLHFLFVDNVASNQILFLSPESPLPLWFHIVGELLLVIFEHVYVDKTLKYLESLINWTEIEHLKNLSIATHINIDGSQTFLIVVDGIVVTDKHIYKLQTKCLQQCLFIADLTDPIDWFYVFLQHCE